MNQRARRAAKARGDCPDEEIAQSAFQRKLEGARNRRPRRAELASSSGERAMLRDPNQVHGERLFRSRAFGNSSPACTELGSSSDDGHGCACRPNFLVQRQARSVSSDICFGEQWSWCDLVVRTIPRDAGVGARAVFGGTSPS